MKQINKLISILAVLILISSAIVVTAKTTQNKNISTSIMQKNITEVNADVTYAAINPSNIKIRAYGDTSNRINIYKNGVQIGYVTGGADAQTFTYPYGGNYEIEAIPGPGYKFEKYCNAANQCMTTNPYMGDIRPTGDYLTYKGYFVKGSPPPNSQHYSAIFGKFIGSQYHPENNFGEMTFTLPVDAYILVLITGDINVDEVIDNPDWEGYFDLIIAGNTQTVFLKKNDHISVSKMMKLKAGTYKITLGQYNTVFVTNLMMTVMANQEGSLDEIGYGYVAWD